MASAYHSVFLTRSRERGYEPLRPYHTRFLTVVPESLHVLSLLRTQFGQQTWSFDWIFRPWVDVQKIVAQYPFFDPAAVVPNEDMKTFIVTRPIYTIAPEGFTPEELIYSHTKHRHQSLVFWSLYFRINLSAARRAIIRNHDQCPLYYKLEAFEQGHLRLIEIITHFIKQYQRIPLDSELPSFDDPDACMSYLLDPDDVSLLRTHEEIYTNATPLEQLVKWYSEHDGVNDHLRVRCCEFTETVDFVISLPDEARTCLFNECRASWEPPLKRFDPKMHVILLAVMMRIHWATLEAQRIIDLHGKPAIAPDTTVISMCSDPTTTYRKPPTRDKLRSMGHAQQFMNGVDILLDRKRWYLPIKEREEWLYPLKMFVTSHLHLVRAMLHYNVFDDTSLTKGFTRMDANEQVTCVDPLIELFYPSRYLACGEDVLENQNVGYLYVSFFSDPRPSSQIWYRTQASVWIRSYQNKRGKTTIYRDAIRNSRFCTWLSTVCRTFLLGTYRHSSVFVPFRWQLAAFNAFMPRYSGKDTFLHWLRDNQHIAKLAIQEYALMQMRTMPVLLDALRSHFVHHELFEYFILMASDDVRRIITSRHRDANCITRNELAELEASFVQRARRRATTPSTKRRKFTRQRQTQEYTNQDPRLNNGAANANGEVDMMSNIAFVTYEYISTCEKGLRSLNHRTYSQKEFVDAALNVYVKLRALKRPISEFTDPSKPLDSALNVTPLQTRKVMELYARSLSPTDEVSFRVLRFFGFSEHVTTLIELIQYLYRVEGNRVRIQKTLSDPNLLTDFECYALYYFLDLISQSKCVVPTLINSTDLVANQIRAVARTYGKDIDQLTKTDAELVVSTRRRELMVGTEIRTLGVYGRGYNYFTGEFDDATKEARVRQRCMHSVEVNPPLSLPMIGYVVTLYGIHLCAKYRNEDRTTRGKLKGSQPPTASSYTAPAGLSQGNIVSLSAHDGSEPDATSLDSGMPRTSMHHYLRKIKISTVIRPHTCLVKCDRCSNTVQYFPEIVGPYRGSIMWCGNCPSPYNVRYFLRICFVCRRSISQTNKLTVFTVIDDASYRYVRLNICSQCVALHPWMNTDSELHSRDRCITLTQFLQDTHISYMS